MRPGDRHRQAELRNQLLAGIGPRSAVERGWGPRAATDSVRDRMVKHRRDLHRHVPHPGTARTTGNPRSTACPARRRRSGSLRGLRHRYGVPTGKPHRRRRGIPGTCVDNRHAGRRGHRGQLRQDGAGAGRRGEGDEALTSAFSSAPRSGQGDGGLGDVRGTPVPKSSLGVRAAPRRRHRARPDVHTVRVHESIGVLARVRSDNRDHGPGAVGHDLACARWRAEALSSTRAAPFRVEGRNSTPQVNAAQGHQVWRGQDRPHVFDGTVLRASRRGGSPRGSR